MQPETKVKLADEVRAGTSGNTGGLRWLVQWARVHRPVAWLIALALVLVLLLVWLPTGVRLFFWHGLRDHLVLTGMMLTFGLVALSLTWSAGQSLDSRLFLFLNIRGDRPAWLDTVLTVFTQLGNSVAAMLLALLFYLSGKRLLAYELVLGTITLWLMVELVKVLAHRRRPYVRLPEARVVGVREGGRSFPSGHTTQSFFVATLIAASFQTNIWVTGALYALALFVGLTRIYVGAHYPRDVLAGAILGIVWGVMAGIVFGYFA